MQHLTISTTQKNTVTSHQSVQLASASEKHHMTERHTCKRQGSGSYLLRMKHRLDKLKIKKLGKTIAQTQPLDFKD